MDHRRQKEEGGKRKRRRGMKRERKKGEGGYQLCHFLTCSASALIMWGYMKVLNEGEDSGSAVFHASYLILNTVNL